MSNQQTVEVKLSISIALLEDADEATLRDVLGGEVLAAAKRLIDKQ